jgi:hypothetical protein
VIPSGQAGAPRSRTTRSGRFWAIHDLQVMLVGLGILAICVGGVVLAIDIPPRQYPAIIGWLVAALIVHDVLVAGAVFTVALAGRRLEHRVGFIPVVIAQGTLAVGAIVALIVIPEIVKQQTGTANPSVLPLDYTLNLVVFQVGLVVFAGLAIALHSLLARQVRLRRSPR